MDRAGRKVRSIASSRTTGAAGRRSGRFGCYEQSGRVDLNHRPPGPEPGALTGLRYAPSAPRRTRTPSLLIRSQALYPVELWARVGGTRLELVASTMSTWRSNQLS